MTTQREVLHITPKLNRAGVQTLVLDLCSRLSREFNPTVLVIGDEVGALAPEFQRKDIDIHLLKTDSIQSVVADLITFLRRESFDAVHVHDIPAFAPSLHLAARANGVEHLICSLHGMWKFSGYKRAVTEPLWRIADPFVTAYVPVSKATKDYWVQQYGIAPEKTRVVYNGIDTSKFDPRTTTSESTEFDGEPVVGTVGSLTPVKGQSSLIKAVPSILERFPDTEVVLVGDGPLRSQLESLARSLGVKERVRFMGTRQDIVNILSQFDVFIFPSRPTESERVAETLGIAVLEAMAMELPVIASDTGGVSEVIQHGKSGLLISPGDSDAIAESVKTVLSDQSIGDKLARAGRERVLSRFSIEKTVEAYEAVYRGDI